MIRCREYLLDYRLRAMFGLTYELNFNSLAKVVSSSVNRGAAADATRYLRWRLREIGKHQTGTRSI